MVEVGEHCEGIRVAFGGPVGEGEPVARGLESLDEAAQCRDRLALERYLTQRLTVEPRLDVVRMVAAAREQQLEGHG